jgi:nucleoside-diphosphate kinase
MMERTLVVVKPDGVQRGLIGRVIARFEHAGFKIVALKMLRPTKDLASRNYPDSDEWYRKVGERSISTFKGMGTDPRIKFGTDDPIAVGKTIKGWLVRFLSSGNVVAMVLEGNNAATHARKLVGETDPVKAISGSIRADFSIDDVILGNTMSRPMVNIVHASGNAKEAADEIKIWFDEKEMLAYKRNSEEIFYKQW